MAGRKPKTKLGRHVNGELKYEHPRTVRVEIRMTEYHKQVLDWLIEDQKRFSIRYSSQADIIQEALEYFVRSTPVINKMYPIE